MYVRRPSDRSLVLTGRVIAVIGAVAAVAGSVMFFALDSGREWWVGYLALDAMMTVAFGLLAWLVLPGQPRNPVVWVLVGFSMAGLYVLGWGVAGLTAEPSVLYSLQFAPGDLSTTTAWILFFAGPLWIPPSFLFTTFGLLLFPDGKLLTPRWRWVAWLAAVGILLATAGSAWSFRPWSDQRADEGTLLSAGLLVCLVATGLSLVALIERFLNSSGVLRQQLKWIVFGMSVLVPALFVAVPQEPGSRYEEAVVGVTMAATAVMIGCFGTAVARYRLYDIDVVINRAVVLGVLAAFITLVYALIVVGLGGLIGTLDQGLGLPILATAVVAVAFEPVRNIAQRWANRAVYGRRATPYEVLAEMTERLARSEPGQGILARMAALLAAGAGADRAIVWLGAPGEMTIGAIWPASADRPESPVLASERVFPVRHEGEIVGALELIKPRGVGISPAERTLMSDLAGSVGLVLGYHRLNDSLAAKAAELAESRARLLVAQDQERRVMERELRDGAQRLLGSLREKIGAARDLAADQEVEELVPFLETVDTEAALALDEVRSLAKGIYPPVLETEGLRAALGALASGAPVEVDVDFDGLGRYAGEVEAAVYFDVSEAVTNAVKHARPPVRITLEEADGNLSFAVLDSGPGFDPGAMSDGSGLANMSDRLDALGGRLQVESAPGRTTTIRGEIPVRS